MELTLGSRSCTNVRYVRYGSYVYVGGNLNRLHFFRVHTLSLYPLYTCFTLIVKQGSLFLHTLTTIPNQCSFTSDIMRSSSPSSTLFFPYLL